TSGANGPQDIYVRAADGSGEARELLKFDKSQIGALSLAVSPDEKVLAYGSNNPRSTDIDVVPLTGDRKPQPFLNTPARESMPTFSPDGKWLAFEFDTTATSGGRSEVYITPFPSGGPQYQVSTNGGERPVWRRDGKEIYYREGLRIMAVEVSTKTRPPEFSTPKALFELAAGNLNGRYYDVSPDGRFLTNTSPRTAQAQSFSLVVNWPDKLTQSAFPRHPTN